jgi:hypothetical protein
MKETELQISQFIDNELNDDAQKKLFEVLTEDKNARQMLSDFLQLKQRIAQHHESINEDLQIKPHLLKQSKNNLGSGYKYKKMFYISTAAAIVLAALSLINRIEIQNDFMQFNSLQKQYSLLKMENAKALIEKEAKEEIQKRSSRITMVSKSKINRSYKAYISSNIQPAANSNQLKRMAQISEIIQANKAVITKEDFIGGQIVGN